ncbi:MAG: class I SAM-dependent methyltransferase [Anaerolineales bacterium]|jgi:SAM-dependent methyltransferase
MSYEKSAHLYDLFDQKDNIELFYYYASRAERTLDVGAGTGRIAIPLVERGLEIYCVEPSPAMRAELERKLTACPDLLDKIQIIPGDAASFEVDILFPVAFLSGCFDHFVNQKQRITSLENVHRHLILGGVLVFDVFLGLMKDELLSPAGEVKVGSKVIRRSAAGQVLSPDRQRVDLIYEIYESGEILERIKECGQVGITDRQSVHPVLHATGFEIRREWGGYDFKAYREAEPLLIVEAVKRRRNDLCRIS